MFKIFAVFALVVMSVGAFVPKGRGVQSSVKMVASPMDFSFPVAELFSGPTARYNGELIDQVIIAFFSAFSSSFSFLLPNTSPRFDPRSP